MCEQRVLIQIQSPVDFGRKGCVCQERFLLIPNPRKRREAVEGLYWPIKTLQIGKAKTI